MSKEVKDTILTNLNDKIILTYRVTSEANKINIDFSQPRVLPSAKLNKECKGELDKIKVVIFDRIGDFGKVKWSGHTPSAFMVPSDLSYDKTSDGFYILGESQPLVFNKKGQDRAAINLPLCIAIYDKKNNYRIVALSKQPLEVAEASEAGQGRQRGPERHGTVTERVAVTSYEESEGDNDDIVSALSSITLVKELLARETEVPFSQALQMEIYNLRSLKNRIKETEVVEKINDVLLLCSDKEIELKELQNQSLLAAQAQEQALMRQQKQEAEAQQKAAEEKAREQEEKQQKRTIWMIIGGAILGICGFIGNAVFKHYRDINTQKSIMQMQESLARQAQHEAGRRAREIVRNKAHKTMNQGKNKLREKINSTGKQPKNNKPRSI